MTWDLIAILSLVLLVGAVVYIFILRQRVRKIVRNEIKKTEERRASFVSIISHQLRTPLSITKGYLEGLVTGDQGELKPGQKEYISEALKVNKEVIDLVNDYLEIVNLDSDTLIMSPQSIQLEELIEDEVRKFTPLADASNCKLEFIKPEQPLPAVKADLIKIRQVVVNIFSNAIKYSRGENIATIELKRDGEMVIFSCQDRGVGIPEEQQQELFTKFFRAKNILHKDVKGSGLGLYLAKIIVEALGGNIWLESKEGEGTKVSFSLPIIS